MAPIVDFNLFGSSIVFSSYTVLAFFALITIWLVLIWEFRKKGMSFISIFFFLAILSMGATIGSRLFYLVFESPAGTFSSITLLANLQNWHGLTFYGALFCGLVLLYGALLPLPIYNPWRNLILDRAAMAAAFMYFVMRIGCFLQGCCWGKICTYPWAVQFFDSQSSMPGIGLPVHPVQLYDATLGLIILITLIILHQRHADQRGHLMKFLLVMLASGRLMTEYFRADAYRGLDPWLGLSWTQWFSLGILTSLLLFDCRAWLIQRMKNLIELKSLNFARALILLTVALSLLMLNSCRSLPEPPSALTFNVVKREMSTDPNQLGRGSPVERFVVEKINGTANLKNARSLIFAASDPSIQYTQASSSATRQSIASQTLLEKVRAEYRASGQKHIPQRLEDLAWWMSAQAISKRYHTIIRIHPDEFDFHSLSQAMNLAESYGKPFDLLLLVHGIDNIIYASDEKHEHLSYRNIPFLRKPDLIVSKSQKQSLDQTTEQRQILTDENRFHNLDTVMLLSCAGWSLRWEFFDLGARNFLAFDGLTRNFFYYEFFLKHLAQLNIPLAAWRETNQTLKTSIEKSEIHRRSILEGMPRVTENSGGYRLENYSSLDDYFNEITMPLLLVRRGNGKNPLEFQHQKKN